MLRFGFQGYPKLVRWRFTSLSATSDVTKPIKLLRGTISISLNDVTVYEKLFGLYIGTE